MTLSKEIEMTLMRQRLWNEAELYAVARDLISLGAFLGLRSALFICGELSALEMELH